MTEGIATFYKIVAPSTYARTAALPPDTGVTKTKHTKPLGRCDFLIGSSFATWMFISEISLTGISLVGNLFTCCRNQNAKNSFFYHGRETLTHLRAIPVGVVGAFFPQTINENVLNIPEQGFFTRVD